jgi:phospholipase/carboxylesterase
MARSRLVRWFVLAPLLGCGEPGVGDGDEALDTETSTDASSTDGSTSTDTTSEESTSTTTDAESTSSEATDSSDSTETSETSDGTDTTETTGDGDACPSLGAGGSVGQAAFASDAYPNNPGVIHVPQSYDPNQPIPLMVALHGSGDTAGNFVNLWAAIAEAEGFIVLVPESISGGASWNRGADTPVIGALADSVAAQWNVDTCRIYLTGYSAGAHYGYMLGLANSTYFAAMGVQAGTLQYAEQAGIWPNMVERPIAVDIHHGQADPYVPFTEATHARDELEGAGHTVYFSMHPGGHEVPAGNAQAMWDNIANHTSLE